MPLQKIDIGLSNLPVSHRDNGMTLLDPAEKAYLEQCSVTVESCRGDQLLHWLNRRKRSRAIHNSLIKETCIAKEVKFKIEAPPGEQICRFAFPRTAIHPLELRSGGTMRNNVRVKFRRNDKRIGYLQITQETGEMK